MEIVCIYYFMQMGNQIEDKLNLLQQIHAKV